MGDFDIFSDEFQENSQRHWAEMRSTCPVAQADEPFDWFALTREQDIRALLRDWRQWTSEHGPGLAYTGGGVLVSVDPPQHTSDRRLVNAAFKPADLLAMEDDIVRLMNEQIDRFAADGEGDLMKLFAVPIPMIVIAWLLGLDPDVALTFRPRADGVISKAAGQAPTRGTEGDPRFEEFRYHQSKIDERRAMLAAGEELPDDTLTSLVVTEIDGRTLTDEEIVGFMSFLFIAGSQTTTQLIGNLVYRLLQHPEQLELLLNDRSYLETAVEEGLRYDSPVHGLFRTNVDAATMHGVDIPENSKVLCTFSAANHDPEYFDDPSRFDITRSFDDLKKHYSFGKGIHYCMGAPLARLEGRVAIELILDRLPNLRLLEQPTEISATVLHGVETLVCAWDVPEGVDA